MVEKTDLANLYFSIISKYFFNINISGTILLIDLNER